MADPKPDTKKEEQHSSKQGAEPAKTVLPEGMSYPTPELNPETGAPIDTRFQRAPVRRRRHHSRHPKAERSRRRKSRGKDDKEEGDEDDDDDKKSKEKPKGRR